MVMPKGYKKTEIGIIPENWEIGTVESFGSIVSGGTPSTTNDLYWNGNIRWCTPTDIKATTTPKISHTQKHITEKGLEDSSAVLLPINSVMICTRATIGEIRFNSLPMATNQGFKNIIVKNGDYLYLYYILTTKKHEMIALSYGTTFLELSKKALCAIPLQIPKISEQHAISNALYTIDILIDNLEKLIEKKKNIKQGAMQELLTGKRRLPGFTGEWEIVRFGNLSSVYRGGSPRPIQEYITNSLQGVNWIKIGDTRKEDKYITSTVERIIPEGVTMSREVFAGDLLLSNSMSFGRPYILRINGCIHDGWLVIQDYQDSFNQQYLYYSLLADYVKNQFTTMAAGSGVHNLNKDIVSNVVLHKPEIDEQEAIASILSDMDNEIEELEKKLTKYRNLKQGMMSELLTGHIRLTEKEDA